MGPGHLRTGRQREMHEVGAAVARSGPALVAAVSPAGQREAVGTRPDQMSITTWW